MTQSYELHSQRGRATFPENFFMMHEFKIPALQSIMYIDRTVCVDIQQWKHCFDFLERVPVNSATVTLLTSTVHDRCTLGGQGEQNSSSTLLLYGGTTQGPTIFLLSSFHIFYYFGA